MLLLFRQLGLIRQPNEFWEETAQKLCKFERTLSAKTKGGYTAYGYTDHGKVYILHNKVFVEGALNMGRKTTTDDNNQTGKRKPCAGRLATDAKGTTTLNAAQAELVVALFENLSKIQ